MLSSLMLLALTGCPATTDFRLSTGRTSSWEEVTHEDSGTVCLAQGEEGVTVYVTAPGCMSSSCTRNLGGRCAARVLGQEIFVTSTVTWETDVGWGTCSTDCGIPTVSCALDGELSDGMYTVSLGISSWDVEVPLPASCDATAR